MMAISKMKNGGSSFVVLPTQPQGLLGAFHFKGYDSNKRRISSGVLSLVKTVFTDLTIVLKRWSFFVLSNLRFVRGFSFGEACITCAPFVLRLKDAVLEVWKQIRKGRDRTDDEKTGLWKCSDSEIKDFWIGVSTLNPTKILLS